MRRKGGRELLQLPLDRFGPLLTRITAPQEPCDDAIAGVIGIAEIEAPLIHLVPREVADHAQDGALAERTAVL